MTGRPRRIVDLSVAIDEDVLSDPAPMRPRIDYVDHVAGRNRLLGYFPGLTASDLPDRQAWATETVHASTHCGTHMDAPWHYHPTQDASLAGGPRPAQTIDAIPLEWCFRPGVRLDFRHLPDGHVVSAAEVAAELERIGHDLQPLDIVLVNTAAGACFGTPAYLDTGVGMGREATLFLTSRGVRVVGTDAWSWDAPFSYTARRWAEDRDPSIIWEGHKAGREIGYCQLEKLTRLDELPATGFEVICFPVKVARGSAGWVRAVALVS